MMATAKKSEHELHLQQGPQHPQQPAEKPKEKEGYPGAPDDTWKKDSEPHPITPGKPAPIGPDEQGKGPQKAMAGG